MKYRICYLTGERNWRDPSLSGKKCREYKPYNRFKQLKGMLFVNKDWEMEEKEGKNLSVISVWIEVETFSQNLWADEKSVYHDCCDFCRHKQMCYFVGDRVKNQMLLQTAHFKPRQNAMKSQLPLIVWISLRQIFCQVYTSWKII